MSTPVVWFRCVLALGLVSVSCTVIRAEQKGAEQKGGDPQAKYARPELLVEPAGLSRQMLSSQKRVVILDARSKEQFDEGHLPGAIWVDYDAWKKAFGNGTDKIGWSERIGQLGIVPGDRVVVYDQALTGRAARIWWILKYWGAEEVAILNGGMKAWEAAEKPIDTEVVEPMASEFEVRPQGDRLVTHDELKQVLTQGDPFKLFDVRTTEEHDAGKIATCTHLDWQDLVDKESGKMLPAAQLEKKFADAGYDLEQPAVTYCQSGGRASVMAFALELMGAEQVANYYGSWGEWSEKELPKSDEE